MPGYKDYQTASQLKQEFDDRVYIYLESRDDRQIIGMRWFKDDPELKTGELKFIGADEVIGAGGGGCQAVIRIVKDARNRDMNAYGIVDRDALQAPGLWDLWWEENDDVLQSKEPYGKYIRVLLRWEIENYLLDVEELEKVIADTEYGGKKGKKIQSERELEIAVNDFLKFADELKEKSAATLIWHQDNLNHNTSKSERFPTGIGCNPVFSGKRLSKEIQTTLTHKGISNPADAIKSEVAKIEFFDRPNLPGLQRWERLTRLVDGKATLQYLGCQLKIPFNQKRGELARRMKDSEKVPKEIKKYISEFKKMSS